MMRIGWKNAGWVIWLAFVTPLFGQTKELLQSGENTITITSYPPRDLTEGRLPITMLKEEWNTKNEVRWDVSAVLALLAERCYDDDNETLDYLFRGMGFTKWVAIKNQSMAGHVITGEDVTVVIFRGTNPTELPDWYANLSVNFIEAPFGRFHSGFTNAYKSLKKDVRRFLDESRSERLWVTGHSLGGAMAVACGCDLVVNTELKPTLVTFGQPRYTDSRGAQWIDENFAGRYVRFVRGDDIVPSVPFYLPNWFPYAHAGNLVAISNDGVTLADSVLATPELTSTYCGNCGRPSMMARTEVYQPAVEPPPLTEQEFRASLGTESALLADPSGQVTAVRIIPRYVRDHLMTGYRELIRRYRDGQAKTDR